MISKGLLLPSLMAPCPLSLTCTVCDSSLAGVIDFPEFLRMFKDELLDLQVGTPWFAWIGLMAWVWLAQLAIVCILGVCVRHRAFMAAAFLEVLLEAG